MPMSFEPGLSWIKRTDAQGDWVSQSSVLGWGTHWFHNSTAALNTTTNYPYVASVNDSGVKLWGTATSGGNVNGRDYVMYSWKGGHPENETQYNGGVKFDGNGDCLWLDDSADLELGSEQNWTVEFSFKKIAHNGDWRVIIGKGGTGGTYEWFVETFANGNIKFLWSADGATAWTGSPDIATGLSLNEWYNVSINRDGTSLKAYVNGTQTYSGTINGNIYTSNKKLSIGGWKENSTLWVDGYISNVRIVKGTTVRTANYDSVTGTPLTNITNTKLLCCQSLNDFTAGRVKPGNITADGDAKQINVPGPYMRFCKDGTVYSSMSAISNNGDHARVHQATVNTTSGFGMYHWKQDSGGSSKSIPHGLNQAPDFVVMRHTNNSGDCFVSHSGISSPAKILYFTDDKGEDNSSDFGSTFPDDTVIHTNTTGVNGREVVICAWHNVEGLQKFGTFYGCGNNDGAYVHLGFRPAVVFVKRLSADGNWGVSDDARNPVSYTHLTLPTICSV